MRKVISYQSSAIRLITFFLFGTWYLVLGTSAYAVCPVCTVAVGAGLGLARYFGVDDIVSGVWVGGLILSSSFWLANWLQKKNFPIPLIHNSKFIILVTALMYAIVFIPLWLGKTIGHPFNTVLGIDKLIFGTILGSIAFLTAVFLDKKVRKIYGHQLFIYQKVVFPVSILVILSLTAYFLTKP